VACDQEEYEEARELFMESLAICREHGNKPIIAENLEGLAAVAAAQGQHKSAAHLFGAAEGLRAAMGAPLPPPDRAAHDRCVAAVRDALGEEVFSAAWAAGRAQALEDTVASALAE
jgi:hypothetical protein